MEFIGTTVVRVEDFKRTKNAQGRRGPGLDADYR